MDTSGEINSFADCHILWVKNEEDADGRFCQSTVWCEIVGECIRVFNVPIVKCKLRIASLDMLNNRL